MEQRQNKLTVILGKKGSGKSSAAAELVQHDARRLYIDPMRCFTDGVIISRYADLVAYLRPLLYTRYSAIFRSISNDEMLSAMRLPTANDNPEAPPMPDLTMVIDEADKWCTSQTAEQPLDALANYGRHFGVSVVFIARRAAELPKTIRANADRYIIGYTFDPGDVDYIEGYIGPDKAKEVRELPPPTPGERPTMVHWP